MVDSKIIYIGETQSFSNRINNGYGNISPRNCYVGGQVTNCKMNKVVIELYEMSKLVDLFFLPTSDYKRIEKECLTILKNTNNKLLNSRY